MQGAEQLQADELAEFASGCARRMKSEEKEQVMSIV